MDAAPAFMIDGPRTVDRDDAIRLATAEDGTLSLEVYIADLTSALDADPGLLGLALERGATRYRRQVAVETMLPADVEAAATLAEGQARPALLVRLPLDGRGVPGPAAVSRCVLGDAVALTYEDAAWAVKDPRHPHHAAMTELRVLAEELFRARYGAACAFYDLARGIFVDEDGRLVKVKAAHVVGHLIVQECMIAANRAVAEWALAENVPIVFRNHAAAVSEPPARIHLADLSSALRSDDPDALGRWLARAELTGKRARYDAYPREHAGLGIPVYCHATSPLRRAADLVTQRAIVACLGEEPAPFTVEQVAGYCERLTVVIAEAKAAGSETWRAEAHAIARHILEEGTDYQALTSARFFALVKRATKEGICSPGFLTEVARRGQAGVLELRDLYHILLLPEGEAWAEAKSACLAGLLRKPEGAVSLVAMYPVSRGLAAPEYPCSATGPDQARVFTVTGRLVLADGAVAEGAARRAPTKKAAQAQAAVSLLAKLAGVPDPSVDIAAQPPARTDAPTALRKLPTEPHAALNFAVQTGLLTKVRENIDAAGAEPAAGFKARITALSGDGAKLEASASGRTKKLARTAAVEALIGRLRACEKR